MKFAGKQLKALRRRSNTLRHTDCGRIAALENPAGRAGAEGATRKEALDAGRLSQNLSGKRTEDHLQG